MKKINCISESGGLVINDGTQWFDLCDLICEYIFDLKDGLQSSPFFDDDDAEFDIDNLISYYEYKHPRSMKDYIIPNWVGYFQVMLNREQTSNGRLLADVKMTEDNKLSFKISVGNIKNLEIERLNSTLVHEFLHAYSKWLERTKHFRLYNRKSAKMYKYASEELKNKLISLCAAYGLDYINLRTDAYTNKEVIEHAILSSFYYSTISETRSYILQFGADVMTLFRKNYKEIKQILQSSSKFNGDFNLPTSFIYDKLPVTCYSSLRYRTYKSYLIFWKGINNIDEELAEEVINDIEEPIKVYLSKQNLNINFDNSPKVILNQLAKRQIPIYNNTIDKMQRVFAHLLLTIKH